MAYKVIIVDDSAFMRSELKRIIEANASLSVIALAKNGEESVELARELQPDVITMDINMPVMDGLTALGKIMSEHPCPIVMISALTDESADETINALALGAFDFFHKPSGSISLDIATQAEIIRQKIITAAKSRKKNSIFKKSWSALQKKVSAVSKLQESIKAPKRTRLAKDNNIVAVGVSTGGPRLLMSILPKLPTSFNGCIVIAQHMPEKFTYSFAKRLDGVCRLKVKEAVNGELLQVGWIYIAPGGKHLRIRKNDQGHHVAEVTGNTFGYTYVPSVDILFRSLLESSGNRWLGVMLTGMGSDGAAALTDLRKYGGHTIVESEESCVVYGMPRKVVELDGAEFILNESEIASKIVDIIGS